MNYTQLTAAIKAYCENDFPQAVGAGGLTSAEQVARFVQQAEQRIYNTIQFPSIRKNVTGTTTNGNKYLSAPGDFLAVYSMAVIDPVTTEYLYLLNKDVNFIRESYPSPSTTGKPRYYALFGPTTTNNVPPVITNELTFLLGPTPNNTYSVELHYYYYPESITTANTSWLGDNFDSVLLYGAMMEAATFMKSDKDVVDNYTARYNEALALAKRLGDGLERSDAYRSGQARVQPLPQNSAVR
jgi:hypothetical protein